ncbi:MAG: hypothetical protein KDH96_09090 [Candidatus Riesia sp.]|nr:hypothetical protein [Candidatus Riesia sp.]
MTYTLSDVLKDVGATVDQDASDPTGTELTNRIQFANRSQEDWARSYKWKELSTPWAPTVLVSMVSIGLPGDFNEFDGPIYDASLTSDNQYKLIGPSDKIRKTSTEKYAIVRGNLVSGKYLEIHPALASGVSLVGDYQSFPSSLTSLNEQPLAPREYMAKRIGYYVLEARSDSRFPIFKSDSEQTLLELIESQDSPSEAEDNRVPDWANKTGFRIGRD